MKATLRVKGYHEGEEVNQSIGYINTEKLESTDSAVVAAFKTDCRNFAIALNSLTYNSLMTITLETVEDITTEG